MPEEEPIQARTATDDCLISSSTAKQYAGELGLRSDFPPENPYEHQAHKSHPIDSEQNLTGKLLETSQRNDIASPQRRKPLNGQRAHSTSADGDAPSKELKLGSISKPAGGAEKLGTFSGVFVPTTLNVLSVLMFLRFGFILGQSGVVGMMGMFFYLKIIYVHYD